jgi:tRNA pseudouridine38-40 synthase
MTIVRMDLGYDGTSFSGWARQPGKRTVEGKLLGALAPLVGSVSLSVAGRTDAGVHARGQVVSFVTAREVELDAILPAVNASLAPEVVVSQVRLAPEGFDARRSATAREYRYRIQTGVVPDPFVARFAWFRSGELSVPAMREAARLLVGHRDFASFGLPPGKGGVTVRDLQRLAVRRDDEGIDIVVRANAFLRHMVRGLVGTLVEVGSGKREPTSMRTVLRARDRGAAARPAPPHGLTLERVVFGRHG